MRTLLVLALTCAACTSPEPPPAPTGEGTAAAALAVDTSRVRSADVAAAWAYQRGTAADLNGDGQPERLVLAADAAVDAAGQPVWDDGHLWAVFVETGDSTRTLLYAQFVQLGVVEATITEAGGWPRVTVFERGPHRRQAWEVKYGGPGRALVTGAVGGTVRNSMDSILEPTI